MTKLGELGGGMSELQIQIGILVQVVQQNETKIEQWVIDLAKGWLSQPPKAGVVHRKSSNRKATVQSEVAHLKGIGRYASDAWRIFCKDELYRQAGIAVGTPVTRQRSE